MKTIILGLALLTAAAPASAAVYTATYSGTLDYGTDTSGLFGSAGSDLTGAGYTAVYTYDTAAGNRTTQADVSDELADGFYDDAVISTIDASITINGITASLVGDFYSVFTRNGYVDHFADEQGDSFISSFAELTGTGFSIGAVALQNAIYGGTYFAFGTEDANAAFGGGDSGELSVSITETAVVPEPATWALMITGFGLVGAASRRRSARAANA